jgi:hypothetical protein
MDLLKSWRIAAANIRSDPFSVKVQLTAATAAVADRSTIYRSLKIWVSGGDARV